jgi:glycosyltransferase involved in cell wall biosynthesis
MKNKGLLLCLIQITQLLPIQGEIVSTCDNLTPDEKSNLKWSILICTLEERQEPFEKLYSKLMNQIESASLGKEIEVVYFRDARNFSVGFKRNQLLKTSLGKYVNFLDDDDDIHPNYIQLIYEKLNDEPDCVSLTGIIKEKDQERIFIHSIKYRSYFMQNDIYFRPPNHLNTIKREIAIKFFFPLTLTGEDTAWALQIARSNLLKKEACILVPYYFYYPHA